MVQRKPPAVTFYPPATSRDFFLITFLFGIAILLANPKGDFPLNDDWSYGIAVKRFLETGNYYPTNWTSMSLITQVLWGAVFTGIFGFSFEILRLSTLIISLLGIFSIYLLVRHLEQSRGLALLLSLSVAFNPVYFALSNTFMTDVPFMALSVMAMLFFVRNLQGHRWSQLLAGTLLTIVAVLCRQNALFIPMAFAIGIIYQHGFNKISILRAFTPLVMSLGALSIFQSWLDRTGKTPVLYGKQIEDLLHIVSTPSLWPQSIGLNSSLIILYSGLFLLPVLVILTLNNQAIKPWLSRAVIPLAVIGTLLMAYAGQLMPIKANILNATGLGPLSLDDTYLLNMPHKAELPAVFWAVISFFTLAGVCLLGWFLLPMLKDAGLRLYQAITGKYKPDAKCSVRLFFLSGAIIYMGPLIFLGFYDRYLVMLMILLALAFFSPGGINLPALKVRYAAALIVLPTALFTVAATQDYFSWNRARWDAIHRLSEDKNIHYSKINGGFEFNGYSLFNNDFLISSTRDIWWEEEDDLFMIAFGRLPGYEVVDTYSYSSWLPPFKGQILVLREIKDLRSGKTTARD